MNSLSFGLLYDIEMFPLISNKHSCTGVFWEKINVSLGNVIISEWVIICSQSSIVILWREKKVFKEGRLKRHWLANYYISC